MKIKIELNLPFQKLEDYNIETNLDDIIQALPENSSIDKQEILDSILKEGEFRNEYFGLEKNDDSEIILFESDESKFLNILNVLENDKFFYIKKHHHFNIKSGDEYTEISGGERQKTILTGGPYEEYAIANKEEIEKYEASADADQIKIIAGAGEDYLIKSKDFNYDEWLNKLVLFRKEFFKDMAKDDDAFDDIFYNGEEYTENEKDDYAEEYYQILENSVYLEKDGEEVDSGYLELTLYSNWVLWDEDECQGYDRQEEDAFLMSEVDYDHMELITEREIEIYYHFSYAEHAFGEMVWAYRKERMMRKFQEELEK
tara:strand:+ start:136 stop:1080 length:945 start_codon:yes stop_codon:yes gene_type:complete